MNTSLRILAALLAFCSLSISYAQIQYPGEPNQWAVKSIDLSMMPVVTTDALDMEAIRAEDAVVDQYKETPYRFGIEREVSIDLIAKGQMTQLLKGDKIWRMGINCPKATSINLNFSSFQIPEGGQLTIWSKDRSEFLGVFNHLNNKDYGSLAVGLIHSDELVVEYYQQTQVTANPQLTIGTIVHGYRGVVNKWEDPAKGPFGTSGSCNMSVNCPDADAWQDQKRGVALILNGGSAHCTGSLVNNTNEDGTAYFLTAAHCDGNENNWVFYFNHETLSCSGNSGATNQSISGATQLASGTASDYHLILLSSSVPSDYQPFYNGWDHSNSPVSTAVGIHHPAGDVKKISFDDDPLTKTGYLSNTVSVSENHWRVELWERNTTTEGGSSGSPLFDQNHRIIGQLHGGYASCTSATSDWYGALSNSWSGLSTYLDPLSNGLLAIDGLEGGGPAPTCSDGIQNQGETGIDCGGPSCAPCPCDDGTNVTISLTFDNYPEETTWTLSAGTQQIAGGGTYGDFADGSTFTETICLAEGCYDFTLYDSYGDGICCGYGEGFWSILAEDGTVLALDDSAWDDSFTANICIESDSPCLGDLNGDGMINNQDFIVLNSSFGNTCTGCPADLNGSGTVDIDDFTIFNSAFGSSCSE